MTITTGSSFFRPLFRQGIHQWLANHLFSRLSIDSMRLQLPFGSGAHLFFCCGYCCCPPTSSSQQVGEATSSARLQVIHHQQGRRCGPMPATYYTAGSNVSDLAQSNEMHEESDPLSSPPSTPNLPVWSGACWATQSTCSLSGRRHNLPSFLLSAFFFPDYSGS